MMKWYESRTIWACLLVILAVVLAMLGMKDAAAKVVEVIASAAAIYFRVNSQGPIQ